MSTLFGTADRDDLLYQSISEGRRYVGMEHWLPLFSEGLETLFDYTGGAPVILDHLVEEAVGERLDLIEDHYEARRSGLVAGQGGVPYRPLPPDRLYLTRAEWSDRLAERPRAVISPFAQPDRPEVIDMGARGGRNFAAERAAGDVNVFDAVIGHIGALQKERKRVVVACWSEGARDRMGQVLVDHGLTRLKPVPDWSAAEALAGEDVGLAILGLETGFETGHGRGHRRAGHSRRPARPPASAHAAAGRFPERCHRACRGRSGRPHRPRHRALQWAEDDPGRRRAA